MHFFFENHCTFYRLFLSSTCPCFPVSIFNFNRLNTLLTSKIGMYHQQIFIIVPTLEVGKLLFLLQKKLKSQNCFCFGQLAFYDFFFLFGTSHNDMRSDQETVERFCPMNKKVEIMSTRSLPF